jgi:hypothetical protein
MWSQAHHLHRPDSDPAAWDPLPCIKSSAEAPHALSLSRCFLKTGTHVGIRSHALVPGRQTSSDVTSAMVRRVVPASRYYERLPGAGCTTNFRTLRL